LRLQLCDQVRLQLRVWLQLLPRLRLRLLLLLLELLLRRRWGQQRLWSFGVQHLEGLNLRLQLPRWVLLRLGVPLLLPL